MTTQVSGLTIRPFTNTDYQTLARLWNATFTEFPETARGDAVRRPASAGQAACIDAGWRSATIAVVGVGMYDQMLHIYHPRKFTADVLVEPAYQLQGIRSHAVHQILDGLRSFDR